MKRFRFILPVLMLSVLVWSASCSSKAKSWSKENKDTWHAKCMQFLTTRGVEQRAATDFCDCMLKKTSEKYTPAEAEKITPEEEQQLWKQCDYQW
jgi:hypothetical protein